MTNESTRKPKLQKFKSPKSTLQHKATTQSKITPNACEIFMFRPNKLIVYYYE